MTPNVPRNAYTDSPEQHPNLILGSLQLLFWLFFRSSAWLNHINRINFALNSNSPRNRNLQWDNPKLWWLILQAYLVVPFLMSLPLGLVLWILGQSIEKTLFRVALGFAFGLLVFLSVQLVNKTFHVALTVLRFCSITIVLGTTLAGSVVFGATFPGLVIVVFGATLCLICLIYGAYRMIADNGDGRNFRQGLKIVKNSISGFIIYVLIIFTISIKYTMTVHYIAEIIGLTIVSILDLWLFVVLYPLLIIWNTLLYQLDKQKTADTLSFLRWHSAFWDQWQRIPLQGLDEHVLLVIERNPEEGKAALNYLSKSRQRWAAQAVQIELDARELECCTDVVAIAQAYRNLALGELSSPVSSLLNSFSRISEDVAAALNQNSSYNQDLALTAVAERLNGLTRELTRSGDKYSVRFSPIANSWYEIVTDYVRELAEVVAVRQEIDNPYIIGVPLTERQEIFVKPVDLSGTYISTRIEQLLLDRRRPPLLLYGQRRMGKTSLLNNLGRLLPNSIIPMFVDLQGPVSSASDYAGFLYNIAKSMAKSAKRQSAFTLPSLDRETLQDDPFTRFDEWLDKVEAALQQNIALLALDEFEALDNAIRKGRFDEEDVLGMLRHLIQHRTRFKVMLAGSHTIEEFQRWASYLINVQVVHISYLKQPEARQLIEQPVHDFTLRYEPDAVDRVLQLTRCHPFLIQLLCAEIVALKNEQDPSIRRLANLADVEAAIPAALSVGSFFFADIQNNQVDATGLAILQFLAASGEGGIVSRTAILQQFPYEDRTLDLLLQRELIEQVSDGYRFQVELIRRWFSDRL